MTIAFTSRLHSAVVALLCLSAVAACGPIPPDSAYMNRGGPESLLDVSSEVVNLSVAGSAQLTDLSNWIDKDQPTRAELYCVAGEPRCIEAQKLLELQGVPTMLVPSNQMSVALVYERILAHDCESRYVQRRSSHFNANHPSFGCAIAANIVQHVSDKQEFVSPNLSDDPSSRGAVSAYRRAYTAKPPQQQSKGIENSLIRSAKTDN